MWYKSDLIRLIADGKHDEAIAKLCRTFKVSMSHAEEIIREINQYQWFVQRLPMTDIQVAKILKEYKGIEKSSIGLPDRPKGFLPAVKMVRAMTNYGLLEAKLYLEDITRRLKPWPELPKGAEEELREEEPR